MVKQHIEDYGEIESFGYYIPVPDFILTACIGILLFILSLLILIVNEGNLVFEIVYLAILILIIFIFMFLRSVFISKRFYFKVYKEGILFREGHEEMKFMPWNRITIIRTNVNTMPTLKSSFFEISDGWRNIVFNEYLPKNTSQYYYAVALLYMYSTIHKIPFNDNANLLNSRYVREMGFLYPNLVRHGKYFPRKPTKEQLIRKVIHCPKCRKTVIPMRMGRCPSCGYRIVHGFHGYP